MRFRLTSLEKKWILYDVGNSAFTMLLSTLFPIFFNALATDAGLSSTQYLAFWGYALSFSTLLCVFLGPVLGAYSDGKGRRGRVFLCVVLPGAACCMLFGFIRNWMLFLVLFVVAKTLYAVSLVLCDSMLTDITTADRMDDVSSQGFAWGYIGSCVPFISCLALVLFHERLGLTQMTAMSLGFSLTALWWVAFTLPLSRAYKQTHYITFDTKASSVFRALLSTLREMLRDRKIFFFLLAFFCYIDGVYTIIDMSTAYGTALGLDTNGLLLALLLTQFVAFPSAILIGKLSHRISAERLIRACIVAYLGVALFASFILRVQWHFWFLAVFVGMFQGGIQSLSRSYFAKIIPAEKSGQYFGIYDICGKGASFMGTLVMSAVTQITGEQRFGVLALCVLFLSGYILFRRSVNAQSPRIAAWRGESSV